MVFSKITGFSLRDMTTDNSETEEENTEGEDGTDVITDNLGDIGRYLALDTVATTLNKFSVSLSPSCLSDPLKGQYLSLS